MGQRRVQVERDVLRAQGGHRWIQHGLRRSKGKTLIQFYSLACASFLFYHPLAQVTPSSFMFGFGGDPSRALCLCRHQFSFFLPFVLFSLPAWAPPDVPALTFVGVHVGSLIQAFDFVSIRQRTDAF